MARIKASREVGIFFFLIFFFLTILDIKLCDFSFTNVIKHPENDTFVFLVKNSFRRWVACLFLVGMIIDFLHFFSNLKNKKKIKKIICPSGPEKDTQSGGPPETIFFGPSSLT